MGWFTDDRNQFKPRQPNWLSGDPETPTEFITQDQLEQAPQVQRFLAGGATLSLSKNGTVLMGTFPDQKFFVCGYLTNPIDWYPPWKRHDK